jgi:hypothetical protein
LLPQNGADILGLKNKTKQLALANSSKSCIPRDNGLK